MAKTKVNVEPRFSVNKLGEYLTSKSAHRRKRIIEEQKYPPAYITTLYREVREAIIKYVIHNYDEDIINEAIESINKSTLKDTEKENSVLALKEILSADLPDLTGITKSRYKGRNPKLNEEGLDISVNPDVILKIGNKVGAIKIHIIKTEKSRLNDEASKLVGIMLHKFVQEHVAGSKELADNSLCISIDCFGNSHDIAPKSTSRRWTNIHAACEEIVSRWDSL